MILPELAPILHVVGFLAAIAIYGMLLAMVWRVGFSGSTRFPLAAACLGLAWNVGGLGMFGLPALGFPRWPELLDGVAYSALGLLPAVVVHSILKDERRLTARAIVLAAYGASALAALGHFLNLARTGYAPLPQAIHALGALYGLFILPLTVLTGGQPTWRRTLSMSALAVFALTGTEIAYHSEGSVLLDLVGHHASILLALVILYQEYRFALADRFLKRALAIVALITLAVSGFLLVRPPIADVRTVGAILGLWIATALVFPVLAKTIDRLVDRWVLRRDGFGRLRSQMSEEINDSETSAELLSRLGDRLQAAFRASPVVWEPVEEASLGVAGEMVSLGAHGESAELLVPTVEAPRYRARLERLAEGRRLKLDDVSFLEWAVLRAARRLDHLRLIHERYEHELRAREMQKLTTEAELKALRAQLNPHFLFNALTTIGHLIQTAPERALDTLLHLTELLRRVLRSSAEPVTIEEELSLVTSYLEIERARFEERLDVRIDVPESVRGAKVPPLILQPLVENAVKHGIGPAKRGGRVTVRAEIDESGAELLLQVEDSGAGASEGSFALGRARGVGLRNVEERLRRYYGANASLSVRSSIGTGTTVEMRIPIRGVRSLETVTLRH